MTLIGKDVDTAAGGEVHHIGPPAGRVPGLMADLLGWLGGTDPVESLIHARQGDYYDAIGRSSATGESTPFIVFMLEVILEALRLPTPSDQADDQVSDQVARLLAALREGPKTAAGLMADLGLSHRPTFRKNYLHPAMSAGLVEMTRQESPSAKNQKYRLTPCGASKHPKESEV